MKLLELIAGIIWLFGTVLLLICRFRAESIRKKKTEEYINEFNRSRNEFIINSLKKEGMDTIEINEIVKENRKKNNGR